MAKSTSVKLKDGYSERLKSLAETKQRSANWLLNEAVGKYLDDEESAAELRAEVLARHREFQETGLHVTQEEALDWLRRRAAGEDVPVPKAHS
jgi:predicted transcriptional regulator